MSRAAALVVVLGGCASVHSSLHAEVDADYDTTLTYEARCIARGDKNALIGAVLEFEQGTHEDGGPLVAVEDGVGIWGQGQTAGGIKYLFGEVCAAPKTCADYLFLEDAERRIWMKIDTVRPAADDAAFVAQLEEGQLITHAAALTLGPKQRTVFDKVSTELQSAEDTRNAMWAMVLTSVAELSASVSIASATIDAQIQLAPLMAFLAEHNVLLYGGKHGGLRLFEVVRTICVSPVARPPIAE